MLKQSTHNTHDNRKICQMIGLSFVRTRKGFVETYQREWKSFHSINREERSNNKNTLQRWDNAAHMRRRRRMHNYIMSVKKNYE